MPPHGTACMSYAPCAAPLTKEQMFVSQHAPLHYQQTINTPRLCLRFSQRRIRFMTSSFVVTFVVALPRPPLCLPSTHTLPNSAACEWPPGRTPRLGARRRAWRARRATGRSRPRRGIPAGNSEQYFVGDGKHWQALQHCPSGTVIASVTYRKVGRWQEPRCGLRSAIAPHHCTDHPGAALDDVASPVPHSAFFSPHLLRCGQKSPVAGTKALLRHVLPTSAAGNGAQGRAI